METILATMTTSISEFKNNPSAALKKAGDKPFAVLTNNKASFYVIPPELFETITEILFELQLTPVIKKRLARIKKAIPVNLSEF